MNKETINLKRILFTATMLLLTVVCATAQTAGTTFKVVGCAVDSISKEGEPYATIAIYHKAMPSEKPVAMAVTDVAGKFKIEGKGDGDYVFVVSSMGRNTVRRPFHVSSTNKLIDMGELLLSDSKTELKGVEVVAYKPLIKADIDKLAYSVEDDPESKTNTVMDMLKKVPMVTVDGQDNIKVNGSESYKVYVNGKPNNMMTNNAKDVLKSMPATSVKKIEVITNPGPKYDAEGVGGILNIITEGKGPEGYSATLSLTGTSRGGGGGLFATVKSGKLTMSVNYNNNYSDQGKITRNTEQSVIADDGTETRRTSADYSSKSYNFWQGGSLEASYEADSLRLITAQLSLNRFFTRSTTKGTVGAFEMPVVSSLYDYRVNSASKATYDDISGGIDYQRSFKKKGRLLTLSYRIESNPNKTNSDINYLDVNSAADWAYYIQQMKNQHVDGHQSSAEYTFQLDYATPIAEHHTLETGAKYILRQNKATNDKYDAATGSDEEKVFDEENSSHYKHRNDILAAYLGYGLSLKKWSARLGLRYEHTMQDMKYLRGKGESFSKSFNDFVPSAKIGYKFDDMTTLSLNYKMRISRPGIWYLDPYLNDNDHENISQGNPNLVSEKTHAVEMQFGSFGQKLSYNISASYNLTNNSIESVQQMMNDNDISDLKVHTGKEVMYTTYRNIGKRQGAYFSGYASWNILKNTRLMTNIWGGYTHLSDGQSMKNHGWNVSIYGNVQQTIAKTWNVSVSIYKQTPGVELQGRSMSYFDHSFTVSDKLLNDRLNISLSVGNPFNRYIKLRTNQRGLNFKTSSMIKFNQQWAALSVSYRIGKLTDSVKKAKRTIENDDVKDGGKKTTDATAKQ